MTDDSQPIDLEVRILWQQIFLPPLNIRTCSAVADYISLTLELPLADVVASMDRLGRAGLEECDA